MGAQISRKRLTDEQAKKIAQWADKNKFIVVIWASFDPNISKEDAIELLKKDEKIREATKNYLKQSHIETPTKQERELVDLKEGELI